MKTKILIIGMLLFILTAVAITNYKSLKAHYDYAFKSEHFNTGDEVYLKDALLNDDASRVATFRAVRPITMDEYELKHILYSKEEVQSKYAKINFPSHLFLIKSSQDIDKIKVKKTGNLLIGIYKGHVQLDMQDPSTGTIFKDNLYEIELDKNIVTNEELSVFMPENYTWANDKIYVGANLVSAKK